MQSPGSVLLVQKSFDVPDEIRRFDRSTVEIVHVGEQRIARVTFHPGWSWAEHVRPIAQTPMCEGEHLSYVLAGRMLVRMNDGTRFEFKAGDVLAVKPHHDASVVGDDACVILDWAGAASYTQP